MCIEQMAPAPVSLCSWLPCSSVDHMTEARLSRLRGRRHALLSSLKQYDMCLGKKKQTNCLGGCCALCPLHEVSQYLVESHIGSTVCECVSTSGAILTSQSPLSKVHGLSLQHKTLQKSFTTVA